MIEDLLPFEERFLTWIERRGMKWERLRFPFGASAQTTAAHRFRPAGSSRGVVLAVHGAGNDALFGWIGIFRALLLRELEVFTFDLPGHGRDNDGTFEPQSALDAVQAASELCRSEPSLPIHAIGVSLGGSILLAALPRLRESVRSAALIVAPLQIRLSLRTILPEIGPRTLRLVWRDRELYGLTGLVPSFGPFKRRVYPLRLGSPVPPGPFGYISSLNESLRALALEEAARAVTVPTLLVYGARDRIVPIVDGERLASACPSGVLHEISGGTHLSTPLEPRALELLTGWIDRS